MMVTIEEEVNITLGRLLRGMKSDWEVYAEQTRQLTSGRGKRVDILIKNTNGTLIAVETEFSPAANVEAEAKSRLGEVVEGESQVIDTAFAVKIPEHLKDCSGDHLEQEIINCTDFRYSVLTQKNVISIDPTLGLKEIRKGKGGETYINRWPQKGELSGTLQDLAVLIQSYAIPPDSVDEIANIIERAISAAAAHMANQFKLVNAFGKSHVRGAELGKQLLQKPDEKYKDNPFQQIYRMTAAIILNAMIFHETLAKVGLIQDIERVRKNSLKRAPFPYHVISSSDIVDEWERVLEVNYWPIFEIAIELVLIITSTVASTVFKLLYDKVKILINEGIEQTSGLFGMVFQRLIADRKFLATFYTRPEAAVLLANLAIPEENLWCGGNWREAENIKKLRIADFSCGTGTLLTMAYTRIMQLFELQGGRAKDVHADMMEKVVTGFDIMPSAVHLTASMLAAIHFEKTFEDTNIYTLSFGVDQQDHITTGSLELLDPTANLLLPPVTLSVRGKGKTDTTVAKIAPDKSFDLVIMNPPYTRATNHAAQRAKIAIPAFAAFGMSPEQQERLALRTKKLIQSIATRKGVSSQITAAHGNAGLGSYFMDIADIKIRKGGQLAMVLPLSFIVGSSWKNARILIARHYSDIMVITITQSVAKDCAFSADTDMAECLLLARNTLPEKLPNRLLSVTLNERPKNSIEAAEIARLINILRKNKKINCLESGPIGGTLLIAGDSRLGQILDVPIDGEGSCPALAIQSHEIIQTAWQLIENNYLWLPSQSKQNSVKIPIVKIEKIAKRGPVDRDINEINRATKQVRGPFDIVPIFDKTPTYPVLWGHQSDKERFLIVANDTEGRIRVGYEKKAHKIWQTASCIHYNRDCGFNTNSLIVATTERKSIGGRAWPALYNFASAKHEHAFALWCNSTLGLLCHLSQANLQHGGRGTTTISQIPLFPTLDVNDPRVDLEAADKAFLRLKDEPLLPLYLADTDKNRHEIDRVVLTEMLGFDPSLLEEEGAFTLFRKKLCEEPAIHGGKIR